MKRQTMAVMAAAVLGLALLAWNAPAGYDTQDVARGYGTNSIVAAATNLTASTSGIRRSVQAPYLVDGSTADIYIAFQLAGAGTSANLFSFEKSYDSTNWVAALVVSLTASGNTAVTLATNGVSLGNYGYIRCSTITNANGTALTNLALRYSNKW